jgi:hypothetical protein
VSRAEQSRSDPQQRVRFGRGAGHAQGSGRLASAEGQSSRDDPGQAEEHRGRPARAVRRETAEAGGDGRPGGGAYELAAATHGGAAMGNGVLAAVHGVRRRRRLLGMSSVGESLR